MSPRILIVDDEPSVRALVRDVLELDDYDVTEAVDGQQALEKFFKEVFQLVILDIMMPGISGLDVLRRIRADSHGIGDYHGSDPETPVVLLTAASDDDTTWAGWTSGASVFLAKPFDPNNLLDWVERTLNGARGDMPSSPSNSATLKPSGDTGLHAEFRGLNG